MSSLNPKQSKVIKILAIAEAVMLIGAIVSSIVTSKSTNLIIFLPTYFIAALQFIGVGAITYYILATHSNESGQTKHYLLFVTLAVLFSFLYLNTGFLLFLFAHLF